MRDRLDSYNMDNGMSIYRATVTIAKLPRTNYSNCRLLNKKLPLVKQWLQMWISLWIEETRVFKTCYWSLKQGHVSLLISLIYIIFGIFSSFRYFCSKNVDILKMLSSIHRFAYWFILLTVISFFCHLVIQKFFQIINFIIHSCVFWLFIRAF